MKHYFPGLLVFFLYTSVFSIDPSLLDKIIYHKSKDTLSKIMHTIAHKEKGVYLRFGDGDVSLAMGRPDMLQQHSPELCNEMQKAFQLSGTNVFKCLVLNCPGVGFEKGMLPGKFFNDRKHALNLLSQAINVWPHIKEVYTPTALHYCATDHPDYAIRFIRFLRSCKNKILIGNENIPESIRNLLFGADCEFVPTPAQNAYCQINSIDRESMNFLQSNQ